MKNIVKGLIGGLIIGFVAGTLFPEFPSANYNRAIKTFAVAEKINYGVCPNEIGVSSLRDAYISTLPSVTEKAYMLNNFNILFNKECNSIVINNNIVPDK